MAVVQCKNNHYYDNKKFDECPHCQRLAGNSADSDGATVSMDTSAEEGTQGLNSLMGNAMGSPIGRYSEEKTVGLYTKKGFSPVAGWLV